MPVVREKLAQLIRAEITLFDFERWYIPYSWANDQDPLTGPISLRLAEYSYGHWTYEDLISELSKL